MTNPPGHWANASATDSAEGGGCKVRIRRNLAIGAGVGEGPQSTRKLSFAEVKNFGKPPCLLLIKGLDLP
jgi:hypothetical protein